MTVAPELLGHVLVRRTGREILAARIVEIEAYLGEGDAAAHSAAGRTPRNFVIFGPPGHAYVYLIYGMHYCLNVSTEPEGRAGCILFRALEPLQGLESMQQRAPSSDVDRLLSGPGRLCRALGIDRGVNGHDLVANEQFFIARGDRRPTSIAVTRRIGVSKAAEAPRRFYVEGSPAVTYPRGPVLKRIIVKDPAGENIGYTGD